MDSVQKAPLTTRQVFSAWWPLAASWLLMGAEMSLVSASIARLADAKYHLAAFGGIVFPISLLIEAPIIMMLAASTALSVDRESFRRLKKFTTCSGVGLSIVHAVIAFTPLYDLWIIPILNPPTEAIEPGRLGLQLMTPWSWAIADRRFHQGLLIRFGRSKAVGVGTIVRLLVTCSLLILGVSHGGIPGIAVAGAGLSIGVTAEMISARIFSKSIIKGPLAEAPLAEPLTISRLLRFYIPLALTPLLNLLVQPIGSASISRMPVPLENLAAWPPVNGLVFMSRSMGVAFNEVVVSLSDRVGSKQVLGRFAFWLAIGLSSFLAIISLTPLSSVWFESVSGLTPDLVEIACVAVPIGILLPAATVYQSLHTGYLVNAHKTRAVPESVALFLLVTASGLFLFVELSVLPGIQATLICVTAGAVVQNFWLWRSQRQLAPSAQESLEKPSELQ